ncbi:MAG: hypothetical protein AAFN77_24505 [Planctomycetota bacterium]
MSNTFQNQIANSREEFLALIPTDAAVVFFLVYQESVPAEWKSQLDSIGKAPNEYFFNFDLDQHSEKGLQRFLDTTDIERRAYGIQGIHRPLPYLSAFVPGIGFVQTAFKIDEFNSAVDSARAQKQIVDEIKVRKM